METEVVDQASGLDAWLDEIALRYMELPPVGSIELQRKQAREDAKKYAEIIVNEFLGRRDTEGDYDGMVDVLLMEAAVLHEDYSDIKYALAVKGYRMMDEAEQAMGDPENGTKYKEGAALLRLSRLL